MNAVRVQYVTTQLQKLRGQPVNRLARKLEGVKLLDVGCGGGLAAESFARLGADVIAVDPSKENISVASEHSQADPATRSIDYRVATVGMSLALHEEKLLMTTC
jgi:ubiquinone biosynthesis O-methyltransferase